MKKLKPLNKMSVKDLRDWIEWAEEELEYYYEFISDLNKELEKRNAKT